MQAWAEIDLDAIGHNIEIIQKTVGKDVGIIGVIKADAYGHGIKRIVPAMESAGVSMLATISVEEAFEAREVSKLPILILGYLDPKEITQAIEAGFALSLYDVELAALYERLASRVEKRLAVHIALETGMNREGVTEEEAISLLTGEHRFPHLRIDALFSHFYSSKNIETNNKQLRKIQELIVDLGENVDLPVHLSSSYALNEFKQGYFDAVRTGLAIYGIDEVIPGLKTAMTVKAKVMQVKNVNKGEGVGYDHVYLADTTRTSAIVSIGYADGLTQKLEGVMTVLIDGREVPVIGKICMNHLMVDVTGFDVRRGEEVVILGRQKGADGTVGVIKVTDLAKRAGLRHHEIVTRLGRGLNRVYY